MAKKKKKKEHTKKAPTKNIGNQKKKVKDSSLLGKYGLIGLLIWTAIIYIPSLSNGFVNWDDPTYVLDNAFVTSLSFENIKTFFLAGIHPDYPDGIAFNYHPLTMLSLAFNYSMSGLNASSYHITNLLLHLANITIVFFLCKSLFKNKHSILPLVIAAGFALHPLHVESVAWITERKDLLFTLFYLLGMLWYLKSKRGNYKKYIGLTFLAFFLSLLSKPSAVTFPIALILLDYWKEDSFSKKHILDKIPFLILSVIFGMITLGIQGDVAVGDFENYSILQRISFACYGILFYLWNFLFPWKPVTFYPFPNVENMPLIVSAAPFIAIGLMASIFYFFRKNKTILFGLFFFLLNIALTLQLVQVGNSIVSDRYTYLSYFGLLCIVAYGLQYVIDNNKHKSAILTATALFMLIFSFSSFTQIKHWKNGETLWSRVLDRFPNSSSALNNRANYYMDNDKLDLAVNDIKKAYKINPKNTQVLITHSNVMRKSGDNTAALQSANTLLNIDDQNAIAYNTRGNIYFDQKNYPLARKDFEKAIQIDPTNLAAFSNLGSIYFREKNYNKAIEMYDMVLAKNPTMQDALINKGASLLSSTRYNEAIESLEAYIRLKNDNPNAYYYLALCQDRTNDNTAAIDMLTKAIQLDPQNKSYYIQRAQNYAKAGKMELSNADKQKANRM